MLVICGGSDQSLNVLSAKRSPCLNVVNLQWWRPTPECFKRKRVISTELVIRGWWGARTEYFMCKKITLTLRKSQTSGLQIIQQSDKNYIT